MPMLAQIVRDMRPRQPEPYQYQPAWSGTLEQQRACPSLLEWGGDSRNLYGCDSLQNASTMIYVNRGLVER